MVKPARRIPLPYFPEHAFGALKRQHDQARRERTDADRRGGSTVLPGYVPATTGTNTLRRYLYTGPGATVAGITFIPDGTLTANATNYATFDINCYDAVGDGVTFTIATVDSSSQSWTTGTPVLLTVDRPSVPDGWQVALAISKAGAGVTTPVFTAQLTLEVE